MSIHSKTLENILSDWKTISQLNQQDSNAAQKLLQVLESLLDSPDVNSIAPGLWHDCLNITAKNDYLKSLEDEEHRYRWADACFKMIRLCNYSLLTMFLDRVYDYGRHILFQDMSNGKAITWSYDQIGRHLKEIAASFYSSYSEPRVAIVSDNSIESACCDLACLFYDMLVVPLNIYLKSDVLTQIFKILKINIVVTDTAERT